MLPPLLSDPARKWLDCCLAQPLPWNHLTDACGSLRTPRPVFSSTSFGTLPVQVLSFQRRKYLRIPAGERLEQVGERRQAAARSLGVGG